MKKIELYEFQHHKTSQIEIRFDYDREMIDHLKKLENFNGPVRLDVFISAQIRTIWIGFLSI